MQRRSEPARDHAPTPSARSARSRSSTTAGSVRSRGRGRSTVSSLDHAAGPRRQQHDPVGEQHRLLDVVRHEHHRPRLAHQRAGQPALQLRARQRVERAERLVEAQHRPARQQRAQERDALAHAARQLARAARARSPRARTRRSARAPRPAPRPSTAPATRSASPALSSALSHGSSPSRCGISAAGGGVDRAGVRRLQPAHELEQRRLAAPARPDDRERLARPHAQAHAVQRLDGAVRLGDALQRRPRARSLRDEAPPREPRSVCASLPPRALPHRFEGSAPGRGRYLSRPPPAPLFGPPQCYRAWIRLPVLRGERVLLRPVRDDDAERVARAADRARRRGVVAGVGRGARGAS